MLEQVEQKIQQLQNQQKEEYYKKKNEDLIEWGLTSRSNGKKNVPIIVTDDEYETIVSTENNLKTYGKNKVAAALTASSFVIGVLGAICGIVLWIFAESMGFVWFSVSVVAATFLAILFRGVAEVIMLLQLVLRNETKAQNSKPKQEKKHFPDQQPVSDKPFTNAPPVHHAYTK